MLTKVRTPLILVNFKTYSEAIGRKAVILAKIAEKTSLETEVCIGLAPQFVDITSIASTVSIPVFAQHIDPIAPGSFTGHILPESVRKTGAVGTLINHSERRLGLADIDATITRARESDLLSVVCANNSAVSAATAVLKPNMIAVEPPELIGGKISVSTAHPDLIKQCVEAVGDNSKVLTGAGVHTKADVEKSLELGAKGVLVASEVALSKNPKKAIEELLGGF